MKKKLLQIFTIIILCTLFLAIFNTKSYAGNQSLNNLKYDVQLNADGSADIIETWNIRVSDTNTLFKTFELDSTKYGNITNVEVKEISKTGITTNFIKTNEYAYHVEKGYYYALNTKASEFEIAWGVSINSSQTKTYQISYTITNAVKTYNDCSEFYWQFIGDTNGIPADKVVGEIKLPVAVSNKDNLRVWAHGPLNGEIYVADNQTVTFEVKYLEAETMVEVRIVSLENIFTQNANKVNANKLDSILSEETKWANEANNKRERLKQSQERKEKILKILSICLIISGIGIVIFFIFKIVKYIKELRKVQKIRPEQEYEYFRDFPDTDSTPAEAAFLYYFDKKLAFKSNLSKIVSATILSLGLKNAVTFEKGEKDNINIVINRNVDISKLKKDENDIYDLLIKVENYTSKKNKQEIDADKISMKDIEKYAKKNDRTFLSIVEKIESKALSLNEEKKNYDKEQIKLSDKWKNKAITYFIVSFMCICFAAFVLPLFIVLPCLICGILCNMLAKKTRNLTQKGANEQEEWKGLKRFMENFSLLDEREVPELAIWEKYLVYATAFGVADKVLKQLKVKYPELLDDDYMISHGYTYMYMMNRYNFDRALNSGMQKAYSAGLRERAARESASSSGYGGGGGFSGGGRTVVAVGGRNGWQIN